jgi:hypothetical protein
MNEGPHSDERNGDRDRTVTNLVLLLIFAAIVGAGIWLASAMHAARKADECIAQGRRNCVPLEVPPR